MKIVVDLNSHEQRTLFELENALQKIPVSHPDRMNMIELIQKIRGALRRDDFSQEFEDDF